jgi:hypothetical protein
VYLCSVFFFVADLEGWPALARGGRRIEMGHLPEVTMVHPRADGELPASSCESNAFAPGSAIGPPSMTACSKRTMADFVYFLGTGIEQAGT